MINNKKIDRYYINSNWVILIISFYFFISPFEFGLTLPVIGSVVKTYPIIIALVIIMELIINKKLMMFSFYNISLLIWVVINIISLYWSPTFSTGYLINYITYSVLFILLSSFQYKTNHILKMVNAYKLGSVLLVIAMILSPKIVIGSGGRFSVGLFNNIEDPNNLSISIIIGITISLYFVFYRKKSSLIDIFMILGGSIAVFFTGSRLGFLLILFLLISMIFGFILLNKRIGIAKKLQNILLFIIILVSVYFLSKRLLPQNIVQRIINFDTTGSGRVNIWSNLLDLVSKRPLLGYGVESFVIMNSMIYGRGNAAHNIFLNILFESGYIGLLCFIFFVINLGKRILKSNHFLSISFYSIALISSLTLESLVKSNFWNLLIISLLIAKNIEWNKYNEEKNSI